MSNKTKTTIEETSDSIDPKSLALLGYRVLKLEEASKEAASAQREGVDMLSIKIDTLAHNFVTQADLASSQHIDALQHTIIKDEMKTVHANYSRRLDKVESNLSWIVKIVMSAVLLTVLAAIGLKTGIVH